MCCLKELMSEHVLHLMSPRSTRLSCQGTINVYDDVDDDSSNHANEADMHKAIEMSI